MLTYQLLHPEILRALGEGGHGAQVLIADGNYPLATRSHCQAHRVYLNLAPDLLTVTDVLKVLVEAIPIEAAHVMRPDTGDEPSIFADFRQLMPGIELQPLQRFAF
ncbi:MAG: RbsD/FucU family protein, partial [Chloroflexota bacterium]|nr:RbsD/FucU family protein [Chloroflexota bacterium]